MFLGHLSDLEVGSHCVLAQLNNQYVLSKTDTGPQLISNVCPHQESLISEKDGQGGRICPYHGWSFDVNGNPIGSGTTKCKNENSLSAIEIFNWNHLLFSQPVDLKHSADLTHMRLQEKRIDYVNADYRNVVDLFLDVDHIPLIHKGVYEKIGLRNIRDVDWEFYNNGSIQVVTRNDDYFNDHIIESDRKYGAFWLTVYPNSMIEWQPGSLFVTVAVPSDNKLTKVIVYKYKDLRYSEESYDINQFVWETAWQQDKDQAEKLTNFTNYNLCFAKKHYRSFFGRSTS